MKKFVLLLIALAVAPWARTWEDAGTSYSYARFDGDSLDYFWPTEEIMRNPYFVAEYEHIDSMGVPLEYRFLGVRNDSNDAGDSIWISKYWMDDSLRESHVVMDANVNLDDFRLLPFDSLHTEYILSTKMDERAEQASWPKRKSLFFLYKKDSSYYALCQIGGPVDCLFYLSCQFQDDGTTNFEKVPDVEGIEFPGCPLSLPQSSRRTSARLQDSVPYFVNGTRSRGGASSVIIQNGQPEAVLRK